MAKATGSSQDRSLFCLNLLCRARSFARWPCAPPATRTVLGLAPVAKYIDIDAFSDKTVTHKTFLRYMFQHPRVNLFNSRKCVEERPQTTSDAPPVEVSGLRRPEGKISGRQPGDA